MPIIHDENGNELEAVGDPLRNQVVALQKSGEFDAEKLQDALDAIERIDKNVKEMKIDPRVVDARKKVAAVGGAIESLTDLITTVESGGDGYAIADKSISVMNAIAQFAVFAGPEGQVLAVAVSGITSLTSIFIGISKPNEKTPFEKMQDVITDLIEEKFAEKELIDIKQSVSDAMGVLKENLASLEYTLLRAIRQQLPFDEMTRKKISSISRVEGSGALNVVKDYIKKYAIPVSLEEGTRLAEALLVYSILSHQRELELMILKECYKWKNLSADEAGTVQDSVDRNAKYAKEVFALVPFFGVPDVPEDKKFRFLYAGLYSMGNKKLELIQKNCAPEDKRSLCGRAVTFASVLADNGLLVCDYSKNDRSPVNVEHETNMTLRSRFVIFDMKSSNPTDDFVRIFSIGAAGYVFGSGFVKSSSGNCHRVMAWTPGNEVSNGRWKIGEAKVGPRRGSVVTNTTFSQVICTGNGEAYLSFYHEFPSGSMSDDSNELVISDVV